MALRLLKSVCRLRHVNTVFDTPRLLARHAVQEWLYSGSRLTPIVQGEARIRLEERIAHVLTHVQTVATLDKRKRFFDLIREYANQPRGLRDNKFYELAEAIMKRLVGIDGTGRHAAEVVGSFLPNR